MAQHAELSYWAQFNGGSLKQTEAIYKTPASKRTSAVVYVSLAAVAVAMAVLAVVAMRRRGGASTIATATATATATHDIGTSDITPGSSLV